MPQERESGDLVLAPNEYALISDQTSGKVNVLVGPYKTSLAGTDLPMRLDEHTQDYVRCRIEEARKKFPYADEQSYIVLHNPAANSESQYPKPGTSNTPVELDYGKTVNIEGPVTFALWPGQFAEVVPGHQLRSNQYLVVKVTNDEVARKNWKQATVKSTEEVKPPIAADKDGKDDNTNTESDGDQKGNKRTPSESMNKRSVTTIIDLEFITGKLNIIQGTDVSFFMPPTGIEVLREEETTEFIREALTLERLEYCVLKDENGEKRYVQGPKVVFPKSTEAFVTTGKKNSNKIFTAVELNENMGIYLKIISAYRDGSKTYNAGDEVFMTGKDTKIYFPRAEHAVIKYGNQTRHYAVAIPKGEARYVLNKNTGEVKTISGPKMFLPNPMNEVLVQRILDLKDVELWFPGNKEALEFNNELMTSKSGDFGYHETNIQAKNMPLSDRYKETTARFYDSKAVMDNFADGVERSEIFTPPRTLKMHTKYVGAVLINIWPGYAIQVVNKTGERNVIVGPKSIILDYDQTLEILRLSRGRPKGNKPEMETAYLHVKNNKVSDRISVETADLVNVQVHLSYRVDFEDDAKSKWFSVQNYVKFLSDHMRSIIRNAAKKYGIEEFNARSIDIIRDTVLGKPDKKNGGGRQGRSFKENGMKIYDVEVLDVRIDDEEIASLLINAQHHAVSNTLSLIRERQELEATKEIEGMNRETAEARATTQLATIAKDGEVEAAKRELREEQRKEKVKEQEAINSLAASELKRDENRALLDVSKIESKVRIVTEAHIKRFEAIKPDLVAAINAHGDKTAVAAFVSNLPKATGTNGYLFGAGGFEGILKMAAGTPLEKPLRKILEKSESGDQKMITEGEDKQ